MQREASYFLLIIYSFFIIKPVIPYVSDLFGHCFNEYQHIAVVHHLHGSNHIHYELQKVAEKGESEKNPNEIKAEQGQPHLLMADHDEVCIPVHSQKEYPHFTIDYTSASSKSDYPPPKYNG